ncbi:MAG: hypothetical protein WCJ29_04090 [bacterium]
MKNKLVAALGTLAVIGSMLAPVMVSAVSLNLGVGDFGKQTGLGNKPLIETISSLINVALGFLGILSVIIMLWGGFSWMTSGGEDKKVTAAKQRIIQGIIGLVIILSSWAIASFVITTLVSNTGAGTAL